MDRPPANRCQWRAGIFGRGVDGDLLADRTWMPMAVVHFAAMTAALLAGWMAVRAKNWYF
jgi:hypothetical protein